MFVLVHHNIHQPDTFWPGALAGLGDMPSDLTLHQCLAAEDGTRATCLWEAPSIDKVNAFIDRISGGDVVTNEYRTAENRDGIGVPKRYAEAQAPMP